MAAPDRLLLRRPWLVALAGGTLLGLLVGMLRPIPGAAPDAASGAAWSLPDPDGLIRFDERAFSQVRRAAFWGGRGSMNEGAGAGRAEWRLTGIIADPVPTVLVVAKGSQGTVSLHVGDSLPDGGEIVGITAETVEFRQDGCVQSRILYAPAKPAAGDPCASTP